MNKIISLLAVLFVSNTAQAHFFGEHGFAVATIHPLFGWETWLGLIVVAGIVWAFNRPRN